MRVCWPLCMPQSNGEAGYLLIVNRFADVHYYFSSPTSKPLHHLFSKGSYVYLFHNVTENRAKLEIANHAGTPEQDAFSGYLNVASLRYSYKQPTLFTISIDGGAVQNHDQWHIPSYDEKNEQKYLYKINTLDIYLWTEEDASTLLGHLKSVLSLDKLDIKDTPPHLQKPVEHRDSMSPVVQQLERTAISPDFTPQRQESTTSTHSLPGSPPIASPQPAPLAYNPAAPAAPEPIAHREKTPPPPDAESGPGFGSTGGYNPMPQTQYANVPNTFQSSNQHTPQQAYFSGPPSQQPPQQMRQPSVTSFPGPPQGTPTGAQRPHSGSLPPPPPPPGSGQSPQQYPPSFAPPPMQPNQNSQATSPRPNQPSFQRSSTFGAPSTQYASYPQHQQGPSFGPNAVSSIGTPGTQQQQTSTPSAPPSYSPGQHGYSNYNYGAQQQPQGYGAGGGYSGDMHNQVYRPTEHEGGAHARPTSQRQNSESRQRLEEKVKGVEAGVGKFMKRLDKLW